MKQPCGIGNAENKLIFFDPPTFEQLKEGVSVVAMCLGCSMAETIDVMLCFDGTSFCP